jgi:hypothetical protein
VPLSTKEDVKGPVILWLDCGSEGWHAESFPSVKEALVADRYGQGFIITRLLDFSVAENIHGGDEYLLKNLPSDPKVVVES